MSFDFELAFTGLCVLTYKGARENPDEVDVLLVKTADEGHAHSGGHAGHGPNGRNGGNGSAHTDGHRHLPRLNYQARDLTARSTTSRVHTLVPDLTGRQLGQRDLENLGEIQVRAVGRNDGMTASWRPAAIPAVVNVPRLPADEAWLDWVPSFHRVAAAFPAPSGILPFLNLDQTRVTAHVKMTQGHVQAAEVARGVNRQYLIWDFKPLNGTAPGIISQALAGRIVLRLENLNQPVQIVLPGANGLVELAEPDPGGARDERYVVRASVTNLPDSEVRPAERLVHFQQYYELVPNFPATDIRIPEASDRLDTTSSTFCPPGSH